MDHGLETMFLNLSPQNKNPKGPIQWQIRTHWGRKRITTMILLAKAPPEREFPGGFQLWLLSTLGSSVNVSTSNPCSWAKLGDKWALPKHCPKSQKEKVGRAHLTDFSERSPTQVSMEKYLHKVSLWLPKTKKRRKRNRCFLSVEDTTARSISLTSKYWGAWGLSPRTPSLSSLTLLVMPSLSGFKISKLGWQLLNTYLQPRPFTWTPDPCVQLPLNLSLRTSSRYRKLLTSLIHLLNRIARFRNEATR